VFKTVFVVALPMAGCNRKQLLSCAGDFAILHVQKNLTGLSKRNYPSDFSPKIIREHHWFVIIQNR